jgi:hypothetical protein
MPNRNLVGGKKTWFEPAQKRKESKKREKERKNKL